MGPIARQTDGLSGYSLLSSPTPDLRVGRSALKGVSAPPSIPSFTTTALASLPTQALAFLRNLLADATSAEINGVFHLPSANSSRSSSGTASPTVTAANAASRASAEACWPGLTLEKFLPLVWRQLDSELGREDEVVGQVCPSRLTKSLTPCLLVLSKGPLRARLRRLGLRALSSCSARLARGSPSDQGLSRGSFSLPFSRRILHLLTFPLWLHRRTLIRPPSEPPPS